MQARGCSKPKPVALSSPASHRIQITKWPHKGGARDGAKLGSMGTIHHAKLINMSHQP